MTASIFIALLVLAVLLVYLVVAVQTWTQVHGTRVVTCPETNGPVAVRVDVPHALATAVWDQVDLRLTSCSRWPERQDCDQPCVQQIEQAPSDTHPRTIAAHFFGRKRCAICTRRIDPLSHMTLQPGFMHPVTHKVEAWDDLPAQDLPRAIATSHPLCQHCTLAEMFRQKFPDRVTDRQPH